VKGLAPTIAAILGLTATSAMAAKVEFRGALCLTSVNPTCLAEGWNTGCYSGSGYSPRNLGDNGPQTRLSLFSMFFAENYTLESGNLVGDTFRTVAGTGVGRGGFTFTSQMKITSQSPAASKLTETTPSVTIIGSINDFDGTPGCNIEFTAAGVNSQ
jgi:hypothetical protein